ncbi:glycoside hydrolase family 88 protein [Streptomyces sp. NPDC000594]|uniref:glycoside hydrolase family 88 protein n=1 Tax=Streptomyces sp. NPDC000594 TaxID=3154261 RepID=UPI00332D236D
MKRWTTLLLAVVLAGSALSAPSARATTPSVRATVPEGPRVPLAPVRYEAEDAAIVRGAVESDHPGFTGRGFVDYDNVPGGHVEFTVDRPAAGSVPVTLRYANGTTADRPLDLAVGGRTVAAGLSFGPTGGWTGWRTRTVTVPLERGANTVRLTATGADGGPNLDSLTTDGGPGTTDWSTAVVESTMARFTPASIGGWSYPVGLYLYGQYLVHRRTGDPRLLAYIKSYVDRFVDSAGNIGQSFGHLDSMQTGRLLTVLHRETGHARYQRAARTIRDRLNTYPRTTEGGFWHSTSASRHHQLWADGVYMVTPFLVEYGKQFGDAGYAADEATRQLAVYGTRLQTANGLLRHAWDESRRQPWADPRTGLAPEHWCRAIGWYSMAVVDVLDAVPGGHPRRERLLTLLRDLAAGIERYQDPATGRWFQVVDQGGRSDNWTETSCSSMFTFALFRAARQGYVDARYETVARRGYQGVLAKLSLGADGRTRLADISIGTNVGDYAYYVQRERRTDDLHGLGAFLIMNEQLAMR